MTSPRTSQTRFELDLGTAERIRDAVLALNGVAGLSAGMFGEVSSLFPGGRVNGISKPSLSEDSVIELHIVVDISSGKILHELADEIRNAARAACPELTRIDVIFDDAVSGKSV